MLPTTITLKQIEHMVPDTWVKGKACSLWPQWSMGHKKQLVRQVCSGCSLLSPSPRGSRKIEECQKIWVKPKAEWRLPPSLFGTLGRIAMKCAPAPM